MSLLLPATNVYTENNFNEHKRGFISSKLSYGWNYLGEDQSKWPENDIW